MLSVPRKFDLASSDRIRAIVTCYIQFDFTTNLLCFFFFFNFPVDGKRAFSSRCGESTSSRWVTISPREEDSSIY